MADQRNNILIMNWFIAS